MVKVINFSLSFFYFIFHIFKLTSEFFKKGLKLKSGKIESGSQLLPFISCVIFLKKVKNQEW